MKSASEGRKPSGNTNAGTDPPGESQQRSLWLTSPVLVALLSAAFGLLGTGVGALLQGYWNAKLEQQKFEAKLILDALEPQEDKQRASRLKFLVKAGLIRSLDETAIQRLAEEPTQLPLYNRGDTGAVGCTRTSVGQAGEKYRLRVLSVDNVASCVARVRLVKPDENRTFDFSLSELQAGVALALEPNSSYSIRFMVSPDVQDQEVSIQVETVNGIDTCSRRGSGMVGNMTVDVL